MKTKKEKGDGEGIDPETDEPKKKKDKKKKEGGGDPETSEPTKKKNKTTKEGGNPETDEPKKKKKAKLEPKDDKKSKTKAKADVPVFAVDIPNQDKHNKLQSALEEKMNSSQFRFLNEKLYTSTGAEAKKLFDENPNLPKLYHTGYRRQVAQWPSNPLDKMIDRIKQMDPKKTVADFGCGEAVLAASVPNPVHSFDLYAVNDRVTVCDITHVPLEANSVDVVVFCLSLMGTNFKEYIIEANRVLVQYGILLIAEVKSRLDSVTEFIDFMVENGFVYDKCDKKNKMFIWFEFHKKDRGYYSSKERAVALLKPCLYKKR